MGLMDSTAGLIIYSIIVLAIEIVLILYVCGYVASFLGLNGILWWIGAIATFFVVNFILGLIMMPFM